MTLTRRTLIAALSATPLAVRSLQPSAAHAQAAPIMVLATFSILGDVVRNVGGDRIALDVLVGPDSDAHTFEPSPEDIVKVADAALIVENGLGFESWLDDLYEASESSAIRIAVAGGLPALLDVQGEEHAEGDDHDHGEHDPHVWHDVENVILEVATIRDALAAADPTNAEAYAANAETYTVLLAETHAVAQQQADSLPAERRKLVTTHDSLGYLAAAYGFEVVGTALGSLSTETADPSAGEIAALVEEVEAAGVPAIFAETVDDDLMAQIAEDAGVALAPRLHTDALTGPDGPAADYVALVRHNMTTLVAALGA